MKSKNSVYIGTSLDGYIADKKGGLDWLDIIPNPDKVDMGYYAFMEKVDAVVMGRVTFETVCNFDCDWPYTVPVFVLSNVMKEIPKGYEDKIEIVHGQLTTVVSTLNKKGYHSLYIDGGSTIQNFLKEDLIDEMIITRIPILLGGGFSLFGDLEKSLKFELVSSQVFLGQIVQDFYRRK